MDINSEPEVWHFDHISFAREASFEFRSEFQGEIAGLGLWAWNLSSGEVIWNREEYGLYNLEPDTFPGTRDAWLRLIHPQDLERVQSRVLQALQEELQYEDIFRILLPHGEVRWLMGRGTLERDESGRAVRMVGINMNITERKEIELALLEQESLMREMLEQQRRFVADAGHELRAPLTTIQGNLELLRRFPDMTPQDRNEALDETELEAKRLGRLVSDLLSLARADSGNQPKQEEVFLEQVLENALFEVQEKAREHTLELGPLPSSRVRGDRERLQQLVLILLDNALKYTPKGGRICLELKQDSDGVKLEIHDNGMGISEKDLPHVFERFYRADQARARGNDPGGTGLGLSIAQWIVGQHGGSIALESELGVGTTARVTLPLTLPLT